MEFATDGETRCTASQSVVIRKAQCFLSDPLPGSHVEDHTETGGHWPHSKCVPVNTNLDHFPRDHKQSQQFSCSPGLASRDPVSHTTGAPVSKAPRSFHKLTLPGFLGGIDGSRVAHFYPIKKAQTVQCQEEKALLPLGP